MSTSIESVKCGMVAFDSAIRRAMICWIREGSSTVTSPLPFSPAGAFSGSRSGASSRSSAASSASGSCASRASGASASASAATVSALPASGSSAPSPPLEAAASTSALTMRPPGPVPSSVERSIPCSRAIRRATGEAFGRPPLPSAAGALSACDCAPPPSPSPPSRSAPPPSPFAAGCSSRSSSSASASSESSSRASADSSSSPSSGSSSPPSSSGSAASSSSVFVAVPPPSEESSSPSALASFSASPPPSEEPPPPSPMRAMTSPIASVAPSSATISSVPSASASYVIVALSVSISTSSSPFETSSPSDLSHLRIVPSSIESESRGIVTSGIARDATKRYCAGGSRRTAACKRVRNGCAQAPTSSRSARSQCAIASPSLPVRCSSYARSAICSCVTGGVSVARRRVVAVFTVRRTRLVAVAFAVVSFGMAFVPPVGRVCGYGPDGAQAARPRPRIRPRARNSCAHGYGADAMAGELDPARALADLRALRRLTGDERGAQRIAWTDTWSRAREWLRERVAELPVDVEVATDEAGNLWVTLTGARDDMVVLGSHLDSVPDGGWLDGALGVLGGLEVLRAIAARGTPPVTVALVDWADEEGARFGRSLLGSSLATRGLDPATLRDVHDRDGVTLPDALAAHGVDLDAAPGARARLDRAAAYLELHIEQGPVLEREHLAVGVVTGTAGVERHRVCVRGQAVQGGGFPMDARRDALVAAARLTLAVRDAARDERSRATVGDIAVRPGIPTAVPG